MASLAGACSDDLPEVLDDGGSSSGTTDGTTTTSTNTTPGTATDSGTTSGSEGTTVSVDEGSSSGGGTTTGDDSTSSGGETTDEGSSSSSGTTAGVDDDSIYEIQDGTIPGGANVDVRGVVVTGVANNAIFVQEPAGGQYSGVYVYLNAVPAVAVGDEVDILGTAAEFNELTEIDASAGVVTPTGVTGIVVMPEVVMQADLAPMLAEPWEGVLVRIEGMPLTVSALPGFSEFDVNGGGAEDTRIDNFLYSVLDRLGTYPDFGVGASFTAIQGPLNFNFGEFKIAPRSAADLEGYMGGPPIPGEPIDNLVPGDLVVTEVMFDPTCAGDECEWIEVYNASGIDVNLFGLRIQDSALSVMNQGQVAENVLVPAGAVVVLAHGDAASWPYAVPPAAYYGGAPGLNNGAGGDLVAILNATEVLDQTATYPVFGVSDDGISWKLDPTMADAVANDDPLNWCFSTVVFDSPAAIDEYGSPAAVNEAACAML